MKKNTPELEQDFNRNTEVGYEPDGAYGLIRCFEHGAPHPLIRWHQHEEYELHLVIATTGKVYVGDYIGDYQPGSLFLIGPNVPHNLVPILSPDESVPLINRCLHFSGESFERASKLLPELQQANAILEIAKRGIEFYDLGDFSLKQLLSIKNDTGIRSLIEFLTLLLSLLEHTNYKVLSNHKLLDVYDYNQEYKIKKIINYITENYHTNVSMTEIAEKFDMTRNQFSRYFKKSTGNNYTYFVNHLRVNRACKLLAETDKYISTICYSVGYNNVANFNRRFYEIKQMTPTQYRNKRQLS